jgi:hypothetical protein
MGMFKKMCYLLGIQRALAMIIDLKLLDAEDLTDIARASGYEAVTIASAKFVEVDNRKCAVFDVTIKGSDGVVGASVCVYIGKDGRLAIEF